MACTCPMLRLDVTNNSFSDYFFDFSFLKKRSRNGGFIISLKEAKKIYSDLQISKFQRIPCGQCIDCRLSRSREWALRIMLEAQKYEHNYFVTLTYNSSSVPLVNEFYPDSGEVIEDVMTLSKRDLQLFMKRLRAKVKYDFGLDNVRFFACGEYGDLNLRPHYHVCLLNMPDLSDYLTFFKREEGYSIFLCDFIESCWSDRHGFPFGFVTVGDLTWDSAAYTARYIMKKQLGKSNERFRDLAQSYPDSFCKKTDEFVLMSRRPGIAFDYIKSNFDEVFEHDKIIAKFGNRVYEVKPPRYFDKIFDPIGAMPDVDVPEYLSKFSEDEVDELFRRFHLHEQVKIDRSLLGDLSLQNKLSRTSLNEVQYNDQLDRSHRARQSKFIRGEFDV